MTSHRKQETDVLEGKNAVVAGASRGLGRGVAESLSAAGASVLAVARGRAGLDELSAAHPPIDAKIADATGPAAA
jgi:NAD(P)-dependent dehydrogenase (short-subunit alcohol dehydrogenase family)